MPFTMTNRHMFRLLVQAAFASAAFIASVACSQSGDSSTNGQTVIDLYGDALCAGWRCKEPMDSDALDQTKLGIQGTMWLYGRALPMEKMKDFDQTILMTFEKDGRLSAVSINQTRDSDTKKVRSRMDRLDATYRVTQGHIEIQGLDQWFKYVTKGKVILQNALLADSARAPTRLAFVLEGGTKAAEFRAYVKGYNREVDDGLQRLLMDSATTPPP